ncbi:MAG: hypothetical protein OEV36_05580 [Myxococcales bacterium]|nr:hypothetical protein [Myxococcales bacterium]
MPLTTIAILGFVLIQLGIGYWASRRVADEDDYLVAGRRLASMAHGFHDACRRVPQSVWSNGRARSSLRAYR